MPENWKTHRLGELIEINKRSINRDFLFEEIEYIDTSSITENNLAGIQKLKTTDAPSRAKRLVQDNDIIYSTVRPIQRHYGFIKNAKPNTVVSTGFAVLTPKEIDPKFLYYYLSRNEIVEFLNAVAESNTTTFPAFNASLFDRLEVEIPESIEEQHRISVILSALDEKIELNLEINRALERIAQATFKHWFVDFQFPGFDGELVKGLPKGWRVAPISEMISVKDGTHASPKPKESGKYLITSKHLKNHFIDFSDAYLISNEDFEDINRRSKVHPNDVLITMIGTVGNMYFVMEDEINFAIKNIGLFKTSERSDLAFYLYFLLDSSITTEFYKKRLAGSTQQYLTLETLRQTPVIIASEMLMNEFNEISKSIIEKIKSNHIEIRTLTQIRNGLLPKLMSGRIRVAE